MRSRSRIAMGLAVVACAALAGGCAGESGAEPGEKVLTYWASQQSTSIEADEEILRPELEKFTAETGIEVELEVIPFTDLLNRILTATTSGQGPDVVNLGNTWAASLQATGALVEWDESMMEKLGGAGRFNEVALQTGGAEGSTPASIPLYTKVYQLYYNKDLFAAANIDQPPATWDEFVDVGQRLTKDTDSDGEPDQWGLGLRGQAFTNASHFAFILGASRGAEFFDGETPTFDSPEAAEAIDQYLDWMGEYAMVNPSDAENADWADVYEAFAKDRVAMMMTQTLGETLEEYDLGSDDYGIAPMPGPGSSGVDVGSLVGGTNVAILESTDNLDGSVDLVRFLTSTEEQASLNSAYGTIPPVKDADEAVFDTPEAQIARDTLESRAVPLPRVPQETQFETLVGTAVVNWLADTATGDQPSLDEIRAELRAASDKVSAGG